MLHKRYEPLTGKLPIPESGDHMPIRSFVRQVENLNIIDDCGHGFWASEEGMSEEPVEAMDVYRVPAEALPGWTHVVWFDKREEECPT